MNSPGDRARVTLVVSLVSGLAFNSALDAVAFDSVAVAQEQSERPASFRPFVHVVRSGETLASIAQRYYGDPRRESVLVQENGLNAEGGAAIVVGMRLAVPFVNFHRVRRGETWTAIARYFYGARDRAFLLLDANDGRPANQPDVGAELLVPYPLRHTVQQNEDLRDIANRYFGSERPAAMRRIRRFNGMRSLRPSRGQIVLIPLSNLTLSEEGRALVETQTGESVEGGEARALQQEIDRTLPELREHGRRGRFAEAVSLGNRLIGSGQLTGNQIVTIQRELGSAYVAFERHDLAVEAFRAALEHQPDLELDTSRTSPRVLRAFAEARSGETPPAADAP